MRAVRKMLPSAAKAFQSPEFPELPSAHGQPSSAKGTLSSETFTFPGSQGGYYYMPNIVFGCTHETDTDYPLGGPVGIFRMNLEPESFISQESNDPITDKRFSYCLVEPGSTTPMTLRFGDDITWPPVTKIQETPILRYSNGFKLYYFLKALSITLKGSISCRQGRIFNEKFDLPENADPANLLPSMTFNFAGTDMALFYEQVFYVNLQEKQFCLAMFEEETGLAPGVLGAFQQVNTQFEFDLYHNRIYYSHISL
ncbi:aspartic proteinase nepenthesin-1-like [Carex rostrata]